MKKTARKQKNGTGYHFPAQGLSTVFAVLFDKAP